MDTNMTPINDDEKHQHNFMNSLNNDDDEQYYHQFQQQQQSHPQRLQPVVYPAHEQSKDILSGIDKTAYIIIFVAFILGFFMGKTMQPVILRSA
jgi:hypothetical protein